MSFYTDFLQVSGSFSIHLYRCLPTGSILGAGPSRASPGISLGRTVVVRTFYIYVSVLLYRRDFGAGNQTQDMLSVF